jgi:hypothetical protein
MSYSVAYEPVPVIYGSGHCWTFFPLRATITPASFIDMAQAATGLIVGRPISIGA